MKLKLIIINFLTLIRVIGVILLVPVYHYCGGFMTGVLALICYLTDSLDGILARKWSASTFFGALFDGTADKLFTIMNFIVLYLITPFALILIFFEISIVITQILKFKNNLNLQSNIIGKFKVWVLAICVVLTFIISDINSISFISSSLKNIFNSLNMKNVYLILLTPAIIIEFLTLISYILDVIAPKKIKRKNAQRKEIEIPKMDGKTTWEIFKLIGLNPEFYQKHCNDKNLKKLTTAIIKGDKK